MHFGAAYILQCDNDGEFKGVLFILMKDLGVKVSLSVSVID
jgi:hypothetical protein